MKIVYMEMQSAEVEDKTNADCDFRWQHSSKPMLMVVFIA